MSTNSFVPRPEWFTKEWYLNAKKQGITQVQMYENYLFVGSWVFYRWLKEIGIEKDYGLCKKPNVIPSYVTVDWIERRKRAGDSYRRTARNLGVHYNTLYRFIKKHRVNS